jgi:conjugal transfer pilus assembly protein TraB
MANKTSNKIELKQKKLYGAILIGCVLLAGFVIYITGEEKVPQEQALKNSFDIPSSDVKPENIRLTHIEKINDVLSERMHSLEKSVLDLREEKSLIEMEKENLAQESQVLREQARKLQEELIQQSWKKPESVSSIPDLQVETKEASLKVWESSEKDSNRNVDFEIPAGSVVKAILVSGADCSVAVQKPTGPNMVLLRPLDNGKLPRNVRVPLKGSVIIGNAIGDISSERVYIRAERLTLVERNGSFVETEVSAYVSGEDGREGLRGVVVDRSGQIISRAAFAAFLQGVGQTLEATLNNQTIEKLAEVNGKKTILDIDLYRSSAIQGGATALSKLSEYYIKRAEQLQPAIQIAAGRVVDIIFTKTVKVGEKDLKKKLDKEREIKMKENRHG